MRALAIIAVLLTICFAGYAGDDGMPFGQITEADVERLDQFARSTGFALTKEMQRAYEKDAKALARVFQFSTTFTRLDRNARTYGQIVYSSLLRVGETMGVEAYAKILNAQTPPAQQRVRDFLYFPVTRVPQRHRKEAEIETRRVIRLSSHRHFTSDVMIHYSQSRTSDETAITHRRGAQHGARFRRHLEN